MANAWTGIGPLPPQWAGAQTQNPWSGQRPASQLPDSPFLQQAGELFGSLSIPNLPPSYQPNIDQDLIPPGGFQPPPVQALNIPQAPSGFFPQTPQAVQLGALTPEALSQVPNYNDLIAQLGQMRQESAMKGFEPLFQQQREQERERIVGRGLLGAGVENEQLRRLATEQAGVASQALSGIQQETLAQQIAEQQRIQQMVNQRQQFQANLDVQNNQLAAEMGMSKAELETRYGLQTRQLAAESQENARLLEIENYFKSKELDLRARGLMNEAEQIKIQASEVEQNRTMNMFKMAVMKGGMLLDAEGVLNEVEKQDFSEIATFLDAITQMYATSQPGGELRLMLKDLFMSLMGDIGDTYPIFENMDVGSYGQETKEISPPMPVMLPSGATV